MSHVNTHDRCYHGVPRVLSISEDQPTRLLANRWRAIATTPCTPTPVHTSSDDASVHTSISTASGRQSQESTHCNILRHTATHCDTLQHTATHCNTLRHAGIHCSTLQHSATYCNTLQHTATHCNALQHTATHCNTLQHTIAHCNTLHILDVESLKR